MSLTTLNINLIVLACLATVAIADGPGQSSTPGSRLARVEEPWRFSLGSQDEASAALDHQRYAVTWHGNLDTLFYPNRPDPTLGEWVSDIGADAGAFFHDGHANAAAISIEVYPHTPRGRRLADAWAQWYANNGYSGLVSVVVSQTD